MIPYLRYRIQRLGRSLLLIALLLISNQLWSQQDFDSLISSSAGFREAFAEESSKFSLFEKDEILDLTITSDFRTLQRLKTADSYQPAVLSYQINDSVMVNRNIGIRARGNFRREQCRNPPLKLNFKKKEAYLDEIREFDKMKMVGNCQQGEVYEQYLLSEYYIYKMFNMLTDESYRVRLLRVEYVDEKKRKMGDKRYAFLIEPHDALASRLGLQSSEEIQFATNVFDEEKVNLIALFQYMIGNTDWSIPGRHNSRTFQSQDEKVFTPTAVPFDFDYCGLVNPPYAIPSELLDINSVMTRLYRGPCREFSSFELAINSFETNKENFYNLITNSELLTKRTKSQMTSYLDGFYKTLGNSNKLASELQVNCAND